MGLAENPGEIVQQFPDPDQSQDLKYNRPEETGVAAWILKLRICQKYEH